MSLPCMHLLIQGGHRRSLSGPMDSWAGKICQGETSQATPNGAPGVCDCHSERTAELLQTPGKSGRRGCSRGSSPPKSSSCPILLSQGRTVQCDGAPGEEDGSRRERRLRSWPSLCCRLLPQLALLTGAWEGRHPAGSCRKRAR